MNLTNLLLFAFWVQTFLVYYYEELRIKDSGQKLPPINSVTDFLLSAPDPIRIDMVILGIFFLLLSFFVAYCSFYFGYYYPNKKANDNR